MKETKPIIVKKTVKHTFTPEETAGLNKEFGEAYDSVKSAEADFDAVKAVHKSKITEAESRMTTLRATINAGFEMRQKDCVVVFRPGDKKKDFYSMECLNPVAGGELLLKDSVPLFTEEMTQEDFERDLIQAESAFEKRVELTIWQAGPDRGRIIVGSLKGKWYSAVRGNVGSQKIEERLDSEQRAFKKRCDAVSEAGKRAFRWLKDNLKDSAKGFEDGITKVVIGEQDKAE